MRFNFVADHHLMLTYLMGGLEFALKQVQTNNEELLTVLKKKESLKTTQNAQEAAEIITSLKIRSLYAVNASLRSNPEV